MTFPDYSRSVLNVACSALKLFGAESGHDTLPEITSLSRKSHVALVILDGMGIDALRLLPEGAFLKKRQAATLTSVCPSTTTAATNALYSGLSPAEHGWLGWSCYFKEYARLVDIFLDRDSYTFEKLSSSPARALMPFESVFSRIRRATCGRVATRAVFPFEPGFTGMDELRVARTLEEAATAVLGLDGREAFTLLYWPDPDETMHTHGARGEKARRAVTRLNAWAESLAARLRDTALVVTADHGLMDVTDVVWLNERPELMGCLQMPPSLESRAASLLVKRGRSAEFERAFRVELGEDFLLMPREEALTRALFGPGALHPKADDFIGDYMALATGKKALYYRPEGAPAHGRMIGHHAGLTEAEMLVPLILA